MKIVLCLIFAASFCIFYPHDGFSLTPAVDLSGKWSGTVQIQDSYGYCAFVGSVTATLQQDGNALSGSYVFTVTSAKSTGKLEGLDCSLDRYAGDVRGTIDGTRVILSDSEGLGFSGSATSDMLTLNFSDEYVVGTTKLQKFADFSKPTLTPKSEPTVDEMVQTGVSYLNEKQFDKALGYFSKIIGKDPGNIMGWMGKGVSYVGLKNYDQAITHFKKSLEIDPNNKDVLQWLGRTYYLKNDCKTASSYYSKVLKIDPQNTKAIAENKIIDACLAKQVAQKTEPKKKTDDVTKKKTDDATKKAEEKIPSTQTKIETIEPPSPSVFKVDTKTKPLFKALWDGKCDTLSKQWELLTTKSGRLPIVCTGGTIALQSGEIIRFSVGDDWEVKLLKWGGEGLAANYVATTIPPLGALMKVFETATSPIETIKTLNLAVSKGQVELLGGVIKINAYCGTGNCKLLKTEEEGGGFKLYDIPSVYDQQTKTLEATVNHNSVYILVEYAPEKITEKIPKQKTSASKQILYENKQYGFSIKYPSNWEKQETLQKDPNSGFVSIVSFALSQNTISGIGFSADNQDYKGLNEKQFLAKMKKQISDMCSTMASQGVTCSEITTSSDTHKNGYTLYTVYYFVSAPSDQGTVSVVEVTTYIPDGNDIWSLQIVSTSPAELEQLGKDLDSSLNTFTIYDYKGVKSSKTISKQTTKTVKTPPPVTRSDAGTLQLNSGAFSSSKYSKAEVIVSGQVNHYQQGVLLALTITKPDGTSEVQNAMVTKDGDFKTPLKINGDWPAGTYMLSAKYGSQDLGSISFQLNLEKTK